MKQTKTKKGKRPEAPDPEPSQEPVSLLGLHMASILDESEANRVASTASTKFAEAETLAEQELYETAQVYRPYISIAAVAIKRNIELIRKEAMLLVYRTRILRLLHRLQCLAGIKDGKVNQFGCAELLRQIIVLEEAAKQMKAYVYINQNGNSDSEDSY
jgi:hypothetical protein